MPSSSRLTRSLSSDSTFFSQHERTYTSNRRTQSQYQPNWFDYSPHPAPCPGHTKAEIYNSNMVYGLVQQNKP